MYNKYYLMILVTFLTILIINYIYYIKNKQIEKFEENTCLDEDKFIDEQVSVFCNKVCSYASGRTEAEKKKNKDRCTTNCPNKAKKDLLKGMAMGADLILKTAYKAANLTYSAEKKKLDGIIDTQQKENDNIKNILGNSCTQEQLTKIQNDMKKDKYLNWVKMGNSSTQYSNDGLVENICSSDKNFINTNKIPHFKKSDIYDLIDQHSIIGLNWKYVANYGKINMDGYTEITSDYIVDEIKDKLNNNKPLTFKKSEMSKFFNGSNTKIDKNNYIIVNNKIYRPYRSTDGLPAWLYSDKHIINLRLIWKNMVQDKLNELGEFNDNCKYTKSQIDKLGNKFSLNGVDWGKIGDADDEYSLISKYNQALKTKTDTQNNCKYTKTQIDNLGNKFTANGVDWGKIGDADDEYSLISKYNQALKTKTDTQNSCKYTKSQIDNLGNKFTVNSVDWGKIGDADDEYSLISDYNTAVADANDECLIPGSLAGDINNLPDKLVHPTTYDEYGKYSPLSVGEKYNSATYNYPYIDINNLEGNIDDMCFVKNINRKDSDNKEIWGKKRKYGGDYGLIGPWQEYLDDLEKNPSNAEKRYGLIKTKDNRGTVGLIGSGNGYYAKVGYTYDNPSGLRWVLFKPTQKQKEVDNPNIIINTNLSKILTDNGANTIKITKNTFDNLGITITKDNLIQASDDKWYKPRDIILMTSKYCDSTNNDLMEAVRSDEDDNWVNQIVDLNNKYYSDNLRFNTNFKNCPKECNKDSNRDGACAPCFKNGIITAVNNDWSKLVTSIKSKFTTLDDLIKRCENNLTYNDKGVVKSKKTANEFKHVKFVKVTTKPKIGNEMLDTKRNPNVRKNLILEYLEGTKRNDKIYADIWDEFGIDKITPYDYIESWVTENTYYILDNQSFIDILKEYKDAYSQQYETTRGTLKDCDIEYDKVLKSNNTCYDPDNRRCVPADNMTQIEYEQNIEKETKEGSDWYNLQYGSGHNNAKFYSGKYYPVIEDGKEIILGQQGNECVSKQHTKKTNGKVYVPPNHCDDGKVCQPVCKECPSDDQQCKSPEFKYSQIELNNVKTERYKQGEDRGKADWLNKYDDQSQCNPPNWVQPEENGLRRVQIASQNACTGDKKCDTITTIGWNKIMSDVADEKKVNEDYCQELGGGAQTCLSECAKTDTCTLDAVKREAIKSD